MSPVSLTYGGTDTTTLGTTWRKWTATGCTTGSITDVTDGVWKVWDGNTATSWASSTACNTDAAWGYWVEDYGLDNCTVYRAANDNTWNGWVVTRAGGIATRVEQPVRTAAEIAAHDAQVAESRRKQEEIQRKRTAAAQRAERLLLELLDEEQTKQYRKNKKFRVVGQDGMSYEVDAQHAHGNIKKLGDDGKFVESYCVPLSQEYQDCCPTADHVVAQLLALRHNIDHLLAKANRTQILPNGDRRVLPRYVPQGQRA